MRLYTEQCEDEEEKGAKSDLVSPNIHTTDNIYHIYFSPIAYEDKGGIQ